MEPEALVRRLIDFVLEHRGMAFLVLVYLLSKLSGRARKPKTTEEAEAEEEARRAARKRLHDATDNPFLRAFLQDDPEPEESEPAAQVTLAALSQRVEALAAPMRHDRRLARLRPRWVTYVEAPVSKLSAAAVSQREDSDGAAARALSFRLKELSWQQARYEQLAAQHTQANTAERIGVLDKVANDILEPLAKFASAEGPGLPGDMVTILLVDSRPEPRPAEWDEDHLLVLKVNQNAGTSLLDYDGLLRALGTQLFFDVRGLSSQIYANLSLAPFPRLPPVGQNHDERSARALFGALLPALFGEAFATLRGGPAHGLALLTRILHRPGPSAVRAHGDHYVPEPPPLFQLRVCTQVLRHQDFDREAEQLERRFRERHGEALTEVTLPLRQGLTVRGPAEFFLALCDALVANLLDEPLTALDDYRLTEVPGLCHLEAAEDLRRAESAAVLSGRAPSGSHPLLAVMAVCGALDGPLDMHALTALLRMALQDPGAKTDRPRMRSADVVGLRASLRDRNAIREAMALSLALSSRKRSRGV